MAVHAFTDDAASLLARIRKLIDGGRIDTWAYDNEGDFTHTASTGQWKNEAWLRPSVETDRLRLRIIKPKNKGLTREVFAVYHGRFIEMLVAHVPDYFTTARASANPAEHEPALEG
jgi:hypothetical protein